MENTPGAPERRVYEIGFLVDLPEQLVDDGTPHPHTKVNVRFLIGTPYAERILFHALEKGEAGDLTAVRGVIESYPMYAMQPYAIPLLTRALEILARRNPEVFIEELQYFYNIPGINVISFLCTAARVAPELMLAKLRGTNLYRAYLPPDFARAIAVAESTLAGKKARDNGTSAQAADNGIFSLARLRSTVAAVVRRLLMPK